MTILLLLVAALAANAQPACYDTAFYSPSSALTCAAGCSLTVSQGTGTLVYDCILCQSGRFAGDATPAWTGQLSDARPCTSCPAGQTPGAGRTNCVDCAAGKFSAANGTECTNCPAGRFQDSQGATSCELCGIGAFAGTTGATVCMACEPGRFSQIEGEPACTPCGPGQFSSSTGATTCANCPNGTYARHGSPACAVCDDDYEVYPPTQQCVPIACNLTEIECASLTPCDYGFSRVWNECVLCAAGSFVSDQFGSCVECSAGRFTEDSGETACSLCEPGFFQSGFGAVECEECPPGRHTGFSDSAACIECPDGSVPSSFFGASSCSQCDAGRYANYLDIECSLCPAGRFSNESTGGCVVCADNTFAASSGVSECMPCPEGTATLGDTVECVNITGGATGSGGGGDDGLSAGFVALYALTAGVGAAGVGVVASLWWTRK